MKSIHVVAAVIHGDCVGRAGEILISKRPDHLHQGGKWEFPGGKVEPGEAVEAALTRELKEELAIGVGQLKPLIQIHHDYPDKSVFLDVWDVLEFSGEPRGVEGQAIRWVPSGKLDSFEFPAANVPIVRAVTLPDRYWITPEFDGALSEFIRLFEARLSAGICLVQLRTKSLDAQQLVLLCEALIPLKLRFEFRLLLNSDCMQSLLHQNRWDAVAALFDGVHLTATHLNGSDAKRLTAYLSPGQWVAASCHDQKELEVAQSVGCHFVTLSPVRATASHPHAKPLSSENISQWLRKAALPVFALGGLGDGDISEMKRMGFQGVAGIRHIATGDAD
ncbi:MAG: Nudix family hydrolase [Ketobacteraceae bacterium]|nr:Nudix family hydrolase [Ketobacteraceae bacterium]